MGRVKEAEEIVRKVALENNRPLKEGWGLKSQAKDGKGYIIISNAL